MHLPAIEIPRNPESAFGGRPVIACFVAQDATYGGSDRGKCAGAQSNGAH